LVADFEAFSTGLGGSHLEPWGSRPAIFTVMMDDRVPPSAKPCNYEVNIVIVICDCDKHMVSWVNLFGSKPNAHTD